MTLSVFKSSAWHPVVARSVFKSSAWHSLVASWVFKSGAWRQFYASVFLQTTNSTCNSLSPATCTARVRCNSDGQMYTGKGNGSSITADYIWNKGGVAASAFEVQFLVTSGTAATNDAASYVSCGTTRNVTVGSAGIGVNVTVNGTINIRDATSHVVLATASFGLSALKDV